MVLGLIRQGEDTCSYKRTTKEQTCINIRIGKINETNLRLADMRELPDYEEPTTSAAKPKSPTSYDM